GDPEEDKQRPQNVVDGQFSMPFVAAVALREGGMKWDHYARHLGDADALDLCRRVKTVVDSQAEAEFPAQMSAVARVHTSRGSFVKFVKAPKGEPENFVSLSELRAKFNGLVAPYLSGDRRNALADTLLSLEQAGDIGSVLRLTRPDNAVPRKVAVAVD
ncbi:MAG: MmgE/PrpD family protein, partial [Acidiferrobacterales bacterium]